VVCVMSICVAFVWPSHCYIFLCNRPAASVDVSLHYGLCVISKASLSFYVVLHSSANTHMTKATP
jgi:hypothetical protein